MTSKRRWTGLLSVALCIFGCDSGSVGEFETHSGSDDGSAGGETSTGVETSTDTTTNTSASATSTSATSQGEGTTGVSGESSGESSSDSGGGGALTCEGIENHQCAMPVDCGDSCGALESMFDVSGCARQPCQRHGECGDAEFCYRPMDYGGCQSSDVGCYDDGDGGCLCASLPDCGGAYCVSEDIVYGGATAGPGDGLASDQCGPDDGPAFSLQVGTYASDACGGVFAQEPRIDFFVGRPLGSTGTVSSEGPDFIEARYYANGVDSEPTTSAVLHVASADALLSGEYEVRLLDDTVRYGEFSVVNCPQEEPLPCG